MSKDSSLTGVERFFEDDEIIVSKTDLKGRVTYANRVFLRLAGYTEQEVLGQPHSIIRHPEMPRCVFKLLWDTLEDGKEIFAYVINRSAIPGIESRQDRIQHLQKPVADSSLEVQTRRRQSQTRLATHRADHCRP
ncbi:MAG: PAS domain S-box protein [Alphaproteobacteria bacterium]|jgi:PAS domain-containing protein|nr:PAS domain S-box protein [Alphaproteobacteria bacterium]MBT7942750.1 PAS domain S-box protein [Alphaproteobacteria bacterium]